MRWQHGKKSVLSVVLSLVTLLILAGCSSGKKSMVCEGKVQTLSGQNKGTVSGKIVDLFSSFSVETDDLRLESGPLQSSDRQKYIPSAVTREGWLVQRLSDTRFSIINAPQDMMITFCCPSRTL
ncbi:hypothetical protein ACFFJN_19580 [Erwinia mallotivora]|uniref:hypothetical protein n=1 Tax=Erwinia mallotivora TaxID=69222 RepID=UPI0035F01A17